MNYARRPVEYIILACLGVSISLLPAGCGNVTQSCSVGQERCDCYPNGTCNAGLACLSNLCVKGSDGDASADVPVTGAGGASSAAGGNAGAGTGGTSGGGLGGSSSGAGGAGGTSSGAGGASSGVGGAGGASSGAGGAGANADGGACRLFQTVAGGSLVLPTVFLLVDRSGSMFDCVGAPAGSSPCADPANTPWAVLRTGVLNVVNQLQGVVRFGFGAFTGSASATTCPIFTQVATSLNNYTSIANTYGTLGALPTKAETPVSSALDTTKAILAADPSPGPKYILFVTDGEPDFCNDGDPVCPTDSVVAHLQALQSAGVKTLIFGVQAGTSSVVPLETLQAFANAGGGQPVLQLTNPAMFTADECMGVAAWKSEYNNASKTGRTPLGTYATVGGTATVYRPNPADEQALEGLLAGAIAGVKSCSFDLTNGLSVDLDKVDQAHVVIEGQTIPQSASSGWHMTSSTRLDLAGAACDLWRQPSTRNIDFQFPCGTVIGP